MKGSAVKKWTCLALAALALLACLPAQAALSRFDKAPETNRIFRGKTEKSITLLYGEARYPYGALGLIYADVSQDAKRALPMMVVFFKHDSRAESPVLTVTTDSKVYTVSRQSSLNKTGITENPESFHIAVGPSSIGMLQDMARSKSVTITCGSDKDACPILFTAEKRALVKLIAAEYKASVDKVYAELERLDRLKYVEHPAAQIEEADKPAAAEPKYREINQKSSASQIRKLQRYLYHSGYYKGVADGQYSQAVVTAVKKYQKKAKLTQTGIADTATVKKLFAKALPFTPAVTLAGSKIQETKGKRKVFFTFKNVDCQYPVYGVEITLRLLDKKGKAVAVNGFVSFSYALSGVKIKPLESRSSTKDSADLTQLSQAVSVEAGVVAYTLSGSRRVHVPAEEIQWKKIR